ncbi:MAG: polymer-forming cytoskeletal protein [Bacteroidales bacterium]|nr:polymer-forming cytoskeletal protein [Bacteroidales bacterium]
MAKEFEPIAVNRVSVNTEIKGDIITDNDIRIDGKLIGNIVSSLRIVLSESGHIEGDIKCNNRDIAGTVKGNITVNETLTIQSTADIHGNISAHKLVIEQGAVFCGHCTMTNKEHEQSA